MVHRTLTFSFASVRVSLLKLTSNDAYMYVNTSRFEASLKNHDLSTYIFQRLIEKHIHLNWQTHGSKWLRVFIRHVFCHLAKSAVLLIFCVMRHCMYIMYLCFLNRIENICSFNITPGDFGITHRFWERSHLSTDALYCCVTTFCY